MSLTVGRAHVSGHYIRKRLRTAGWARRMAAFALLLLVVSVLVYRLGGVDFEALKALFLVVLGLAVLALVVALSGLVRVWRSGYEGGGRAVGAVALALFVGAPYAAAGILALEYPQTNSAETDGMLAADIVGGATITEALVADEATFGTAVLPLADRPPLSSRRFQARAAQVYTVARTVLDAEGWTLTDVSNGTEESDEPESGDLGISGTIDIPLPTARATIDLEAASDPFARPDSNEYALTAVATSFVLALPSDVAIRIVEDGNETFIDLRSTSRAVAWDLGQNRRFIESFLAALDEAMAGVAAVVPPAAEG